MATNQMTKASDSMARTVRPPTSSVNIRLAVFAIPIPPVPYRILYRQDACRCPEGQRHAESLQKQGIRQRE